MKKFSSLRFLVLSFLVWRINLSLIAFLGARFFPQRQGFLGPSVWANFDGVHYLSIAKNGYFQFEQAFFPFFPLLIRWLSPLFLGSHLFSSLFIIHISLFISLLLFWQLLGLDFKENIVKWSVFLFLFFPTGFYLGSVYNESLFLAFIFGAFLAARKKKWWLAGILGGLATATRLVGICLLPALIWEWWEQNKLKITIKNLKSSIINHQSSIILWLFLIPFGLLAYMFYLWKKIGDPLYFFHAQPAFGAQRSGDQIILLPQVIWRYLKIFATVSPKTYDFWPAVWELASLVIGYWLLVIGWRKKIQLSYLIFGSLVITFPTLTGTLSSLPRYILIAFPMYPVLATINNKVLRYSLFIIHYSLFILFAILFTRGFWVA